MQKSICIFSLACLFSAALFAQAPKEAAPAKGASGQPTAVIDTTVGKMTCKLFPDKAPLGVKLYRPCRRNQGLDESGFSRQEARGTSVRWNHLPPRHP